MGRMLAGLALVLLLGCDGPSPLEQSGNELEEARARWQRQGVASYRYTLRFSCFCPPQVTSPVIITVTTGTTTSIVWADSLVPVPAGQFVGLQSVEQLFERVEQAIEDRPYSLTARYDPALGFLTFVVVDEDRGMADDEWSITIMAFQPAP